MMKNLHFLTALLLALPLAATAQTKSTTTTTPAGRQVTEVTEELDPETGKVIRRTTRTYTEPAAVQTAASTSPSATMSVTDEPANRATDEQVADYFRERMKVDKLTVPELVDAYSRFMDKVRRDRRKWQPANWTTAAAVLSSLNHRYDQLRADISFEDKLTIRSQQAEFQGLRTARQLTESISDKL